MKAMRVSPPIVAFTTHISSFMVVLDWVEGAKCLMHRTADTPHLFKCVLFNCIYFCELFIFFPSTYTLEVP